MKTGVLIINLGTPDEPTPKAVGRYLRQFLMDKWVIDVPKIFRWIMVNLLIVPKRKFTSADAYKKVWSAKGSPLLCHSQEFCKKLSNDLGPNFIVQLAMRYGQPSIQTAVHNFKKEKVDEIIVFPMYPQYAESSTRSSLEEFATALKLESFSPKVKTIPPFYSREWFIKSYAEQIRKKLKPTSYLLLSYHGLPERHVRKTDLTGKHCLEDKSCCESVVDANRFCYRAHCFATSRALAKELNLTTDKYFVSFQSRLGRTPWIKPYTDLIYKDLIGTGKTELVVASPSFVTDCLETIEELGMRLKSDFLQDGGKEFSLVECPNSNDLWVEAVAEVVNRVAKS